MSNAHGVSIAGSFLGRTGRSLVGLCAIILRHAWPTHLMSLILTRLPSTGITVRPSERRSAMGSRRRRTRRRRTRWPSCTSREEGSKRRIARPRRIVSASVKPQRIGQHKRRESNTAYALRTLERESSLPSGPCVRETGSQVSGSHLPATPHDNECDGRLPIHRKWLVDVE